MARGVFYRPEEMEWRPRFKVPLSTVLLSDPAFSSDPRTHPHFNTAFDVPHSPISTQPPKQMPRAKPNRLPPQINRKTSMKALVRRLTSHHNLDRIDELDETDPFGTSYHHDGPYEAIGSAQVPPTPHVDTDIAPRTNVHHSKRAFNPRALHPTHHQSPPWVPSIHGEKELSLHLKPGQILQQNTIYTSHISRITSVPNHISRQSNTPASVAQPVHSRRHSLSNPQFDSPLHPLNDLHNRPSLLSRAPSQRYLGENTSDISNILPHYHDPVPYVLSQTTMTVFPPPRQESRLHNLGFSPPLQTTPPPSVSRKTQATEGTVPSHDARHKSVHSLDSSHTIKGTSIRSSSNIRNQSLEPPRTRHFPKRLVMPSPLQPQPPQPQYRFPSAEHVVWKDEYQGDRTSEGTDPEGQPVVYNQGRRLLRKKSSAFSGELPIPHHVPMFQDDALPEMGDIPTKTENQPERTKEKIRRRRLSKRKNDT